MESYLSLRPLVDGNLVEIRSTISPEIRWHWRGSAQLCGGAKCPLCKIERPRISHYLACGVNGSQASWLVEIPHDSFVSINRESVVKTGETFVVRRRHKRGRWWTEDRSWPVESTWVFSWPSEEAIWQSVARLYRVPDREVGAAWSVWFTEVGLRRLLGVLPGQLSLFDPSQASSPAEYF